MNMNINILTPSCPQIRLLPKEYKQKCQHIHSFVQLLQCNLTELPPRKLAMAKTLINNLLVNIIKMHQNY